jgi:hypothetical protein
MPPQLARGALQEISGWSGGGRIAPRYPDGCPSLRDTSRRL